MTCDNPRHAPCTDCSGEVVVGQFEPITVPKLDADGFPTLDGEGRVLTISLPLPVHVANVPTAHSRFEPTGVSS